MERSCLQWFVRRNGYRIGRRLTRLYPDMAAALAYANELPMANEMANKVFTGDVALEFRRR